MGAVVSCIQGMLQAIGRGIMAVIHGIGAIITGIVNAIVSFFGVLIGCLTCNRAGGRRKTHGTHSHSTRRSRI